MERVSASPVPRTEFSKEREAPSMKLKVLAPVAVVAMAILATGCANTIRGVGQDTANTVNATQGAGKRVSNAAAN